MFLFRGGAKGKDLTSVRCVSAGTGLAAGPGEAGRLHPLPAMLPCPQRGVRGLGGGWRVPGAGVRWSRDGTGQGPLFTWTISQAVESLEVGNPGCVTCRLAQTGIRRSCLFRSVLSERSALVLSGRFDPFTEPFCVSSPPGTRMFSGLPQICQKSSPETAEAQQGGAAVISCCSCENSDVR